MEYTVDFGARVSALAADEDLSDRLLTALEAFEAQGRVAGPATAQNTRTGIVSARFCLGAQDAGEAASLGVEAFRSALQAAGVQGYVPIADLQVEEAHEGAASLG